MDVSGHNIKTITMWYKLHSVDATKGNYLIDTRVGENNGEFSLTYTDNKVDWNDESIYEDSLIYVNDDAGIQLDDSTDTQKASLTDRYTMIVNVWTSVTFN